jgi:hypothetical protein
MRGIVNPELQLPPAELAAQLRPYVALAESGLSKLPAYEGDVYRSMHIDAASRPELYANYTTRGAIIDDAGFYSTSTNPNITMSGDDNVKLVISQQSGREVSYLSAYQSEQEVLFPPGTRFQVLDVETVAGADGRQQITVYVEEVP